MAIPQIVKKQLIENFSDQFLAVQGNIEEHDAEELEITMAESSSIILDNNSSKFKNNVIPEEAIQLVDILTELFVDLTNKSI